MYCYITVRGHLERALSEWFDGLTVTNLDSGEAVLEGRLADQAALHGVLMKMRDLGLPLVALQCAESGEME